MSTGDAVFNITRQHAEVRALLAQIPHFDVLERVNWEELTSARFSPSDERLRRLRRMAQQLSVDFVDHVLRAAQFQTTVEPDGIRLRARVFALTNDELELWLYRAYMEGQTDGANRSRDVAYQPTPPPEERPA